MNKVFKVIWSEARNAYVVVSEIAKIMAVKLLTKKLLTMTDCNKVLWPVQAWLRQWLRPMLMQALPLMLGKKAAVDVAENAKVNVEEGSNVSVDKNVTIGRVQFLLLM